VVISRAGSTIFEIAAWGVPSIIIPINEKVSRDQHSNAFTYARAGACEVIEEDNLTPNILSSEIERLLTNEAEREKMKAATKMFYKPNAARLVAEEILKIALEHEVER
jgi:UDP-N-acetylglucosamine--N-acetylmuramyl-(pentapeptide) pyrophosphoryl-undecaprenol N-acetylglucosamine transferase